MTQPTEAPPEPASRPAKIAAIRAFADWLTAHPEAPVPTMVLATYILDSADEIDEATRVAEVLRVCRQLDMRPYEGSRVVQGDLTIASPRAHGLSITYRASAMKDEPRANTYLEKGA